MTKLSQKVVAAVSAGVMFLSMATSVAAQTTLEISGNGADSTSNVVVAQTTTTTVVQSNSANIHNDVDASANTGNNDANRNTGGSVLVDTGNAETNVAVSNTANHNSATVDCCEANSNTSVLISGNGAGSTNDVGLVQDSSVGLYQDNNANIENDVDARSNTGHNDANRNTGGDVEVNTGNAETNVGILNSANANWAQVGGSANAGTGLVSLRILGNGADSENTIGLLLDHAITVTQDNSARIYNDVDAKSNTGYNDANRNTGGDVLIDTGNAETNVGIDNAVNFNFASVDCGCLLDITGKIAGNGVDSVNEIGAVLSSDLGVFQDNCGEESKALVSILSGRRHGCRLDNDVEAKASSGENDNSSNTGTPGGGDPAVWTGNAESNTEISNTGNANVFGGESDHEWPEVDFDFDFGSWNWFLLALLGAGH